MLKINNNCFRETGEKEYKGRIIAYLGNLKYLDYELIELKEREKADQDFKTELEGTNLEAEEQKDNTESKEAYKALEEAHIHHTMNLFENCMQAFDDYDKISRFLKFPEVVQYSEPNIEDTIGQFQNDVKNKQKEKKKILAFCEKKMREAERNAEVESIRKIEAYKKSEKHIFREINKKRLEMQDSGRPVEYDVYEGKLLQLIETLKGDLLDIELALQQAIETARGAFVTTINNINTEMGAKQQEAFSSISNEFQTFSQKLKEELNREKDQFVINFERNEEGTLADYGF